MSAEDPPAEWGDAVAEWSLRVTGVVIGTVVAAASLVIAAFLTPLRIADHLNPLSWLIAGVGVVLGIGIARIGAGAPVATAFPALGWFAAFAFLASPTDAGDVIIPGNWVGYGLMLVGVVSLVAALFVAVVLYGKGARQGGQMS